MNNSDAIIRLTKELELVSNPIKAKIQALIKLDNEEIIQDKKAEFDSIKDKLFYGDSTTWNGFSDLILLIKPISCNDWGTYNCCKIIQIKIVFKNNNFELYFSEDLVRMDQFKTHYKTLTPEMFKTISDKMNDNLKQALSLFNI